MYLAIALLFLIMGHIFKARRWKRLIAPYESVKTIPLLRVLAIGQGINMIVPFRIGDLARIGLLGKKYLKNGYVLALASVIADLFIDTITVGLAFGSLYLLQIHQEEIAEVTVQYVLLSCALILISMFAVWKKKYVKLAIQKFASLFNDEIERKMLLATYAVFSSVKDTFRKDSAFKLMLDTCGVWVSYFFSYAAFAIFLQGIGYDFTLTGVFKTIFSMAGSSLLMEGLSAGQNMKWVIWFFIYLLLPLCAIFVVTLILNGISKEDSEEYHSYRKILPQLNSADKLSFLNIYFSGENREYVDLYLAINNEVSILQDFSAGSNATTILCMDEERTFYRKYAFGKDAKKLFEQVEWLKRFKENIPLANIIKEYRTNEYCYYDMEYKKDAVGFFRMIHTSAPEDSWSVLKQVLDSLDEQLYRGYVRESDKQTLDSYVEQKVYENIRICQEWGNKKYKPLMKCESVYINGVEYSNIDHYEKILGKEHLQEVFKNDKYSEIHGDLTIENIVCSQSSVKDWYLIDPNTGSLHETPFLDYAKLLQSLHGKYEFLMMVKNVSVENNRIEFLFTGSAAYQQLYEKYKNYLFENFPYEDVRSIYYHEVVHWLRLMPYKIRKNPNMAVVFYAGLLMVLADVEKMFKDEA